MVKEEKRVKTKLEVEAGGKAEGKIKTGLSCIGDICFTEEGFVIKIGKNCDPEFVKNLTKRIVGGNSKVTFEVDPTDEG